MNAVQIGTEDASYPGLRIEATYDPADNKLRLRASARLPRELYERVRAAGFIWAPKQELFVAPMWTPERADLALELAGEIGDEDTTLVDRAEERAERFENYQESRARDAGAAHAAVSAIADNIPLGQPILVGHHSERHARRDAEKIRSGMARAVSMWETSKYWEQRAKGALRHAKYKELPAVRHRRIKGLESEERSHTRTREESMLFLKLYRKEGLTVEQATLIAGRDRIGVYSDIVDGKMPLEEAIARAIASHESRCEHAERWLVHIRNRIAYERAMLDEAGGIVAEKFQIEVGGQVFDGREWHVVVRVNRSHGSITSVSVAGRGWTLGIERVRDYRAPAAGDTEKVRAASKTGPLVNYPGEGFRHMTSEQWKKISQWSEFSRAHRVKASDKYGAHRVRMAPKEGRPYYDTTGVYITDMKRVDPPAPSGERPKMPERELAPVPASPPGVPPQYVRAEPTVFDVMKDQLKAGVQVVSAPQLFPTPPELAERMAEILDARSGHRVLEPSAGTGNLIRAIFIRATARISAHEMTHPRVDAIEISHSVAEILRRSFGNNEVFVSEGDFLTMKAPDDDHRYDRVVMNPPFADGADVEHVSHAYGFLRSGGRLVAVMSAGVTFRQDRRTAAFRALVESVEGTIEELPDDTFRSAGTGVRTVLVTMVKP